MIYLYKTAKSSISYDDNNWYINNIPQNDDINNANDNKYRENATKEAYKQMSSDISKYVNHFHNIAVLTAAGTSMENGENSGKTRSELWKDCKEEISEIYSFFLDTKEDLHEKISSIVNSQNIEDLLSFISLYEDLHGEIKDKEGISLKTRLKEKIVKACTLSLDINNSHHQNFIRKITARKSSEPRVQLYTTNYDTLFEQAAQRMNYTIIDGFSFSYPRVFNGSNFDHDIVYREKTRIKNEESFVPNVIQLFKLHGSVDWEQNNDQVYQKESSVNPCIIYPAKDKYKSSYEQPYFEMMSHFQSILRKESTLLIIIGFGFQDQHIQNVIKEAVFQNTNFHLFIVCYAQNNDKDTGITSNLVPDYVSDDGAVTPNVTILFSKFKAFAEEYPENKSYDSITDTVTSFGLKN